MYKLHGANEILESKIIWSLLVRLSAISLATSKTNRNFRQKQAKNFSLFSQNQNFLGIPLIIKDVVLLFILNRDEKCLNDFRRRF